MPCNAHHTVGDEVLHQNDVELLAFAYDALHAFHIVDNVARIDAPANVLFPFVEVAITLAVLEPFALRVNILILNTTK